MKNNVNIELILQRMGDRGIKAIDLCRKFAIQPAILSAFLNKGTRLKLQYIIDIAKFLNIESKDLLVYEVNKNKL